MYSYDDPRKPKNITILKEVAKKGNNLAKSKNMSFSRLVETLILELYDKENGKDKDLLS